MGEKLLLTVQELLDATKGKLYSICACEGFESVATDSRNVTKKSLFIPLIGEMQDGHKYVVKAFENGASIALIQESSLREHESIYNTLSKENKTLIVVENTLKALQDAASMYVHKFPKLKKVAITGSNGKTTAKECIGSVLAQKYSVITNVGNLNSETGLPLSMFTITEEHEIGIFEMGTNRRGEIKEITDVFIPDVALITNIGTGHIGILGTQQDIAEEKKEIFSIFTDSCTGYVFEDDPYVDFLKKDVIGTVNTYGVKSTSGIDDVELSGLSGSTIFYEGKKILFPLIGKHNAQNAIAAIAIGQHFGVDASGIKKGLELIQPLFGRSEILEGSPTIIQDCYNGSFESMNASLDFLHNLDWKGKKIAFLGDMLELGNQSYDLHTKVLKSAIESPIEVFAFVGENFSKAYSSIKKEHDKVVFCIESTDDDSIKELCTTVKKEVKPNDILLFKGSRGIRLERASSSFKNMFHEREVV